MEQGRCIVWRLTGSSREGQWEIVPPWWDEKVRMLTDDGPVEVRIVPTGDVEWDSNRCAEVWVPESQLEWWPAWKAEHGL